VTLTGAIVTGNTATGATARGAGIYSVGNVIATDSTISDNGALGTTDSGDEGRGGGIFSPDADVTLTDSLLIDNQASGFYGVGAGLWTVDGTVTVTRTTVRGNIAEGTSEGFAGGLQSQDGEVRLVDSTVSGNTARGVGTGFGNVAGVAGGLVTVINSTVTDNTATADFDAVGGIRAENVVLVYATVVANNGVNIEISDGDPSTFDAFGSVVALPGGSANCNLSGVTVASHGYNFSDDATCELTAATDVQDGGDPLLGALGDNGGPTATRLPLEGSPLIDAIPDASCQDDGATGITTDQRGLPRPAVAGCDIGAVEVQPLVPPTPIVLVPTFTG